MGRIAPKGARDAWFGLGYLTKNTSKLTNCAKTLDKLESRFRLWNGPMRWKSTGRHSGPCAGIS